MGYIRVQNIEYLGDWTDYEECEHFQLPELGNAYWLHYKCIGRVVLVDSNTDITHYVLDLLKFKMMRRVECCVNVTDDGCTFTACGRQTKCLHRWNL